MNFQLNHDGYIRHYLYSGRKEIEFEDSYRDTNQLRYEKYLRSKVAKHDNLNIPKTIQLGSHSSLGMPWKYYYSNGNIFLDQSTFYTDLKKVELLAVTELVVQEDIDVELKVWSFAGLDIWINGEQMGSIKRPVYKPIQSKRVKCKLKKGNNQVFIRLETLGVRDTSISFALQVLSHRNKIVIALPDENSIKPYVEAEKILNSGILKNGKLQFEKELPEKSFIIYDNEMIDFRKYEQREIKELVSKQREISLKEFPYLRVDIIIEKSVLSRTFEQIHLQKADYLLMADRDHHEVLYNKIGEVASITRSERDGFAIYPMLARFHQGLRLVSDEMEFMNTLKQIDRRMDCADFMTCGLIRFINEYEINANMEEELKQVMLRFRYWMDEDGQDGMCFWSENHSLMFYQTAYFFGQRYSEDTFACSKRKGVELFKVAKQRLIEWFNDVCEQGFDEFNSGVYSPITFSAILNIVDYAEEELSIKATKAADLLIRRIALHYFKGILISPQGRIYRDVLYPHKQHLQSIIHYIDQSTPYVYSEWLISLATSKYEIPDDVQHLMNKEGLFTYQSSNAVIESYKTKDYILTSVQSPRQDGLIRVWQPDHNEENKGRFSYTKTLNESFHGTMQFEPGVFGYQQHMWYAALDTELAVFINHPGQACEVKSGGRPGYWYGNGIMPALKQENNVLAIIYVIPETYPIQFTHLFWNHNEFDGVELKDKWLFGYKASSYIGIWSNNELIDHDDVLFQCEKRSYGSNHAYLVVCGSKEQNKEWEFFKEECLNMKLTYTDISQTLLFNESSLKFEGQINKSQFVE